MAGPNFIPPSPTSEASLLVLGGGGGGGARPPNVPTEKSNLSCARDLSERAPQKYIFSGLQIHTSAHTMNAVPFCYLWHGAVSTV